MATIGILIAILVASERAGADSTWQTVRLVESHGFSIRLKVRSRASLADGRWLMLELENQSGKQSIVDNLHYRIAYEAQPIGQGTMWSSGLCEGSVIEVFPHHWDTAPVASHVLELGRTLEVVEALSYPAAARLQAKPPFFMCAPDAELNISATAHFSMSVSQGGNSARTRIETPVQGIPFTFFWGPPPRAAVPEMQRRLRALCKDKDDTTDVRALPSTCMACALLDIPDVADGLTDEELRNAAVLTGAFNQDLRLAALKCLFERDPTDRRFLVELDQMIRDNPVAVRRLSQSRFWHVDLAGAVAAATRNPYARVEAQRLLDEHRGDWEHNTEIVRQLQTIEWERTWRSWLTWFGLATIVMVLAAVAAAVAWIGLRKPPARGTPK
jgi:hypothetical protein